MSVCAFTAVCEEDAHWIPRYLAEAERLNIPFAVHLDQCSEHTVKLLEGHRLCIGSTRLLEDVPFNEKHKQWVLDLVRSRGYDWAMAWDIDEVYAANTPELLTTLDEYTDTYDQLKAIWLNCWGDEEHIRIDGTFCYPQRVKFYNVRRRKWVFDREITNGAKPMKAGRIVQPRERMTEIVCLHLGMMTQELRQFKKERWDRLYSIALKGDPNPYGFWNFALDETVTPSVVPHTFFKEQPCE